MATTRPRAAERSESAPYTELAAFFDRFAGEERWRRRSATYHRLVEQITRFYVPAGARVLEIGSGSGDLLAGLRPAVGVGVDVSAGMVELARSRHSELRFVRAAGEELNLGETFDYVVLSDLLPYVADVRALFERAAAHSHQGTRVVINLHGRVWRRVIRLAELLRLEPRTPIRNWVSAHDVHKLLEQNGFEVVTRTERVLLAKQVPLLTFFVNGFVANLWPFSRLCLTHWIVARPRGKPLASGCAAI